MGAAACAALGGAAFERTLLPVHAVAASEPSAIAPQPAAGPASFADIVDRVQPAVVSVKVKLSDVGQSDEEDSQGLPDFAPNSPLYRFFHHFGTAGLRRRRGDAAPSFDGGARLRVLH